MDSNRVGTPKFTCYFCNKLIENETEMGHTAMCGNVLVPCPYKCGSYIPRMDMNKHKRECLNRVTKSMPKLPSLDENSTYRSRNMPATMSSSLDRHANNYSPKSPDPRIKEEIFMLSRKVTDLEKRQYQTQQKSQSHNVALNYENLRSNQMQQGLEIEKVKYQSKLTMDWKRNIESQLYNLKQSLSVMENSKKEMDLRWMTIQDKLILLDKVQMDLNYMAESILKEQSYNRQTDTNMQRDINTLKDRFSQDSASAAAVFNEHKIAIDNLKLNIDDINKLFEEQKAKFTNIVFDLRATSQIASEAAERIEIYERDYTETKKELSQIKLDLEILEGLSSSCDNSASIGRLLWKITEVDAKMQKAKDFDSVLKSPIFYTHEYGYKIRILMYLNGLKKWKDRYSLLCVHVLKGEYDMLLKWPCHIEGTITLRDLENLDKAKPFSKYIAARRQNGDEESEEPQESSSSFIFIPHSTLLKPSYVKEDTLFIDVKIQQNSKLETSL